MYRAISIVTIGFTFYFPEMVEKFQALLRGEVVANSQLEEAFEIVRSRPSQIDI